MSRVVLCEPQFRGFEHSRFNAGLLLNAHHAFGGEVRFFADPGHAEWVKAALDAASQPETLGVEWIDHPALPSLRVHGRRRRTLAEWDSYRKLFSSVRREPPRLVLFCSATRLGLLFIKALSWVSPRVPVLVVYHELRYLVEDPRPRWDPRNLHWLLRLPQPRSLRLVALGEPIRDALKRFDPRLSQRFVTMDPPYLWPPESKGEKGSGSSSGLRFGHLGAARPDAFHRFVRLAREVTATHPQAEFTVAGHLEGEYPERDLEPLSNAPRSALSHDEYSARVRALDYAVRMSDPAGYQFRFSASLLDAFAFAKPLIALRTRFLESLVDRFGDIGYICDSEREVRRLMRSLLDEFPAARYAKQQENMRRARRYLDPQTAGSRLRSLIAELAR